MPPISDPKKVLAREGPATSKLALTGRGISPIVTPRKADAGSPRCRTEVVHPPGPSPREGSYATSTASRGRPGGDGGPGASDPIEASTADDLTNDPVGLATSRAR